MTGFLLCVRVCVCEWDLTAPVWRLYQFFFNITNNLQCRFWLVEFMKSRGHFMAQKKKSNHKKYTQVKQSPDHEISQSSSLMTTIISHFTNVCIHIGIPFVNFCFSLWLDLLIIIIFLLPHTHKNNKARVLFIDQWSYTKKKLLSVTFRKCVFVLFF